MVVEVYLMLFCTDRKGTMILDVVLKKGIMPYHRSRPDPPGSARNTVQASAIASPPEVHLRF